MIIFISLIPCCDCRITFALVEILKRVLNHACITTNPSTREAKSRQSRRCSVINEFCALSRSSLKSFFLRRKDLNWNDPLEYVMVSFFACHMECPHASTHFDTTKKWWFYRNCFITTVTHNQRGIQRSLCLFIYYTIDSFLWRTKWKHKQK